MSKSVAIIQSNYIPWKGYFDIIARVDEFILLDDAQFTKRDWRNRNRIKTANGAQWLTVPVVTKGRYFQAIDETEISGPWAEKHWNSLRHAYGKAPYFHDYESSVQALFEAAGQETRLSPVNRVLLEGIMRVLGIATPLRWSRECGTEGAKSDRLLSICKSVGATRYLSGPAARSYLSEDQFAASGIAVDWMDYSGYPEYQQLHGEFDHYVTVLDLLFSVGAAAPRYMKHVPHLDSGDGVALPRGGTT